MATDQNIPKSIFLAVVDKSPSQRAGFLDEVTAGDPALRERIESLLRAHDGSGGFLDEPVIRFAATVDPAGAEPPLAERPGTVIGPYKLLEQIGEGGMGVVYMAEQQAPVRRLVALNSLALL